ncbi:MAG: ACT domain-containing protein [Anaerolineae bacterium]|nr:ACT domain-containing protein [Anaerolineae bacterium]
MDDLPPGLLHVFAQTRLYTDENAYVILSIPLEQVYEGLALLAESVRPFSAGIVDKDELTLVLPQEVWETAREALSDAQADEYRLITLDLPMELGLVGYIATLTNVLAEAGVSLLVFSAYQRDHVFVPEADFAPAWEALNRFIALCQEREAREG